MASTARELGTILGVWAHPDDETFLTAGLMAAAIRQGNRVACITATRGEAGSADEARWPASKLGEVREKELIASLEILGVAEHYWLDYYDGKVKEVPHNEGLAKVTSIMSSVAPDTVFTFGPDGMTGHPDHKVVCAWATEAFEKVGPPGSKLYYATTTPEWFDKYVGVYQKFDVFQPGTPPMASKENLAIHFELPEELLDLKMAAIDAHLSQIDHMRQAFGDEFLRESNAEEAFVLAGVR